MPVEHALTPAQRALLLGLAGLGPMPFLADRGTGEALDHLVVQGLVDYSDAPLDSRLVGSGVELGRGRRYFVNPAGIERARREVLA